MLNRLRGVGPAQSGVKGWGKSPPAGAAMHPARRACNWEQGEWVRPHVREDMLLNLVAAVRVKPDYARQATSRRRIHRATGRGCAEIDDGAAAGLKGPG